MKRILFFLLLLPAFSFAQLCADEDTVRANSVTLITYNSARVNGTTGHFVGTVLSISLKYVRVGQTDTATSTSAGVNALRNITGLHANTLYVYYYISTCGSGTVKQSVAYTFTTLANTVNYTPMAAMGYQFKYLKADSGLMAPRRDTTIGRAPNYGGQIVWKPEDSTFYGYNGEYWHPLAIDSAGIISLLNDKVDSVTVAGDSLWYWKSGVSYGYILPTQANEWKLVGNSGTTAGTNFIGTTDNVDLVFKRNSVESGRLGSTNTSFGFYSSSAGDQNVAIGTQALTALTSGIGNTAIGYKALQTLDGEDYHIALGNFAGAYSTTGSQELFINSLDRGSYENDTTLSIIYGSQSAAGADQRLRLNARVFAPYIPSGVGTKAVRIDPSTGLLTYADTTTGGAGSTTWNAITNPTADQALTFDAGESSTWTDANTTEDLFTVNSSTGTTNSMFSLNRTGTALASGNNILELVSSGANGTNAITATGARISVTNTNATSGTNVGLAVTASGATTANYAIQATGAVVPGTNNASDLGTSALAWRTGYFGTSIFDPILYGSSASLAGATGLTVSSTSASGAANKGIIKIGTFAAFDEYYECVGIGLQNSVVPLHIKGSSTTYNGLKIENTNSGSYARQDWVNNNGDLTQMLLAGSAYNSGIFTANSASFFNNGAGGTNIGGSHATTGHIRFFTRGTGTVNEKIRISSIGNLLIGGTADPTSSVAGVGIFNGTAPTASIANGTILYSEDVAASSELKVRDEAGNITVLSPHNFSQLGKPSEDLAWSYYSEKDGKYITVDMAKAIRTIEDLSERVNALEKELNLKAKPPVKLLYKGKVKKK